MPRFTALALSAAAAIAGFATPALAGNTQDDIAACRAALSEQSVLDMEQYRLRFESKDGRRTTTYVLHALPSGEGDKQEVICVVKRGKVLEARLAVSGAE